MPGTRPQIKYRTKYVRRRGRVKAWQIAGVGIILAALSALFISIMFMG